MRTVSKAEMRLVKIWLSHVGGVAVLRFLFTYDRRGTNAGLDLPNSEETDCSDPHSAPRPPSDLLGQLLGTNQSAVVKWGFNLYIRVHVACNYAVFCKENKYCVASHKQGISGQLGRVINSILIVQYVQNVKVWPS